MKKSTVCILFVLLIIAVSSVSSGIVPVAKCYSFIETYGGYSEAVGKYTGIGILDFTYEGVSYELDAKNVYDPAIHFGVSLGQLRNGNMAVGIGFRYTKIDQFPRFSNGIIDWYLSPIPYVNVYDFSFDFDYYFLNPIENVFSPFVGVGALAGFTMFSNEGYQTETKIGVSSAIDAGLEVRIWRNKTTGKSVSLTPRVSYEFYASGDRARHLNLGGGLKYYFR